MQFLWTRRFFLSLVGGCLVAITRGDEFQGWMETADGYAMRSAAGRMPGVARG